MNYMEIQSNQKIREIAVQVAEMLKEYILTSSEEEIWVSSILIEEAFRSHFGYQFYIQREEIMEEYFPKDKELQQILADPEMQKIFSIAHEM